jgi:hypothetical protein
MTFALFSPSVKPLFPPRNLDGNELGAPDTRALSEYRVEVAIEIHDANAIRPERSSETSGR